MFILRNNSIEAREDEGRDSLLVQKCTSTQEVRKLTSKIQLWKLIWKWYVVSYVTRHWNISRRDDSILGSKNRELWWSYKQPINTNYTNQDYIVIHPKPIFTKFFCWLSTMDKSFKNKTEKNRKYHSSIKINYFPFRTFLHLLKRWFA